LLRDQAALYGLLFKLADLGIHIISLAPILIPQEKTSRQSKKPGEEDNYCCKKGGTKYEL
jgi:hypothetical protein